MANTVCGPVQVMSCIQVCAFLTCNPRFRGGKLYAGPNLVWAWGRAKAWRMCNRNKRYALNSSTFMGSLPSWKREVGKSHQIVLGCKYFILRAWMIILFWQLVDAIPKWWSFRLLCYCKYTTAWNRIRKKGFILWVWKVGVKEKACWLWFIC